MTNANLNINYAQACYIPLGSVYMKTKINRIHRLIYQGSLQEWDISFI